MNATKKISLVPSILSYSIYPNSISKKKISKSKNQKSKKSHFSTFLYQVESVVVKMEVPIVSSLPPIELIVQKTTNFIARIAAYNEERVGPRKQANFV